MPLQVAGLTAGDETRGHRFLGPEIFKVKSFADYEAKLEKHKVILDPARRAASIAEQAQALAKEAKLELVEDEALLNENAGLTEWPVVLMGSFDEEFLAVPGECLTTSMKTHQKCFSLRDPKTKKLANKFLLVSNLVANDGGAQIISGNEKVIRARLSDAKFFWDQDLKKPLDEMASALRGITFHEKLGTPVGPRASASRNWRSRSRARSMRTLRTRAARRSWQRPISCPAWSASSPSCRA